MSKRSKNFKKLEYKLNKLQDLSDEELLYKANSIYIKSGLSIFLGIFLIALCIVGICILL